MTYPDVTIPNQWTAGPPFELLNSVKMNARVEAWLNLLVPRVSDGGWLTASLGNSWAAFGAPYNTPAYRLKGGIVYFQGLIKSGTTGTTVLTLPAGMRPLAEKIFTVNSNGAGAANLLLFPTGVLQVVSYTAAGSNANVALDGISPFVADQ